MNDLAAIARTFAIIAVSKIFRQELLRLSWRAGQPRKDWSGEARLSNILPRELFSFQTLASAIEKKPEHNDQDHDDP